MATITTLKSGDYTDTLVWSTGTVPVDGDKVTISKLGTATSRTTSSSISSGATSVPVTAGTGTGLIGEVIEFDSRPGEYYELTTGFTASASTAVVTPALAGAIASGATLRNRGHKVKLLGTRVAGDDTSTGVTVNGVLYWDRAANSSLQVKGTYTVSATGTEDRGTAADPLTAVNATLLLNYSAALAIGKYGATYSAGGRCLHYGKTRTRKTTTTGALTAGATSFTVTSAAGWADGDSLLIFPTAQGSSTAVLEERTIASGGVSGNTVTITSGLTNSKLTGAYVANLTSNIQTLDFNTSFGANTVTFTAGSAGLLDDKYIYQSEWLLNNTSFVNQYSASGSSAAGQPRQFKAVGSVFKGKPAASVVSLGGTSAGAAFYDGIVYGFLGAPTAASCAGVDVAGAIFACKAGIPLGTGINSQNPTRTGPITGTLMYGAQAFASNGVLLSVGGLFSNNVHMCGLTTAAGGAASLNFAAPGVNINASDFAPFGMVSTAASYSFTGQTGFTKLTSCLFGSSISAAPTYGSFPDCRVESWFGTYFGGATNQHEIFDNEGYGFSDASTRNRGDAALRITNRTTTPFTYTFKSAIANGATKRLVAYLRRNATYGAGSMPQITLSIPGVTSVSSSVTDTADTWFQTDLSITNTTGSTQEVTVTMSANGAANASSSAWFDGVPIYPFVQIVRHYGFVFDESNPFRVVNPVTVASEATAAAYTGVTVNTSTPSITVGAGTTDTWQKLYDGHQAWGVANLTETVLLTSTDGETFSLPLTCKLDWPAMPGDKTLSGGWLLLDTPGLLNYRLSGTKIEFQTAGTYNMSGTTFSGTVELVNTSGGSVTVNVPSGTSYTNTGPNITVATPSVTQSVVINGLVSGSRVQVYDTTNSIELANGTSTTSFSWTDSSPASGNRDIRVRIAYVSGVSAKEFIEANIGTCGTTSGTEALTYLASQVDDGVYIANNIDGSTVTGITISDGIDRMVINIAGGSVSWPQIYAYNVYWLSTSTGVQDDGAIMTAVDTANYLVTGFMIRNTNSVALSITGGYGRDSATGTVASLIDTAGSTGNIYQTPDHVVAYATGSGLSPAESAKLMGLPDAADVWVEPKALTVGKFLALK